MFTLIMQTYITNLPDEELTDLHMNAFEELLKEFEDGEKAIQNITLAADKALDGKFLLEIDHLH